MSPDPYVNKLLDREFPCVEKSPVVGQVNTILDVRSPNRGLELCPYPSRAVLKHEIHELILTSEETAAPGQQVNRIAYLGYFEVLEGGVLWVGDQVSLNGRPFGVLAGYDLTHFPNHMNIVLRVDEQALKTGKEVGLHPGASIRFELLPPGR